MSQINDGGAAFPRPLGHLDGMSLRDYFAAHALPILAKLWADAPAPQDAEFVAKNAYLIADAMLAERQKSNP